MHLLFKFACKTRAHSKLSWKLVSVIILMLTIGLPATNTILFAQQAEGGSSSLELLQNLTPEQRRNLEKLTPDQRQALKAEVIKNGGKLTPDLIEKLKSQAQSLVEQNAAGAEVSTQGTTTQAVVPGAETIQEIEANRAIALQKEAEFELKTSVTLTINDQTVSLQRFGFNFFAPARTRIMTLEDALSRGEVPPALPKDALAGFIGPLDMVTSNVNASIPPSYILNPGDQITVYYWGDLIELTSLNIVLDEKGAVSLPKGGRLVARGMSLPQFQKAVQDQLQRELSKNVRVIATLDKLKSIQILIFGDAFRPGSYSVSAVTTLFNALYAAGGPSAHGSLHDIKLIRKNTTTSVDFYDYLMKGDARSDYPLQPGDAIFIGRSGKLVSISGEVNRPGVYELTNNENMRALITMAEGIKPTGLNNRVHVLSVDPHNKLAVVDVDMSAKSPQADHALYDGDVVTVDPVISYIDNQVTLVGNVKVPGVYELKEHMRVADLFNEVNQPWGEAFLERADIFRLDKDRKTTTVIPFNLEKALQKDPANNIELMSQDKIVVYSKWDVKYQPEMMVTISGAVQRPGDYVRTVGMKLKDLLDVAGGVLPGTSNVITIAKARSFEQIRTVTVDLDRLEKGDESQNVPLEDMDIVMVREDSEFFERPRWVEISGEVKYPGKYPLLRKNYRLSELIQKAGGLTKVANPKGAVFLRQTENLPSPEQKMDIQTANRIVNSLNQIDYQRQAARNILLLQKDLSSISTTEPTMALGTGTASVLSSGLSNKEAAAIIMGPQIAQSTGQVTGSVMGAFTPGSGVASQARVLSNEQLTQSTRVIINMEKAMQGGDNPDNIVLMNSDSVNIPARMETASVVGAVLNPVTVHINERQKLKDVVKFAGGYAEDADIKSIVVSRANGAIIPANDIDYVEEGDIIYVPTKVLTTEIITTTDKIINALKFTLATAASVIVFLALIH